MSEFELKVIDASTDDNLTGLVIDGKPHLYWLRIYQSLGISKTHAVWVMKRLTEGKHYVKFTREEFLQLSGTVQVSDTVDLRAKAFYFLSKEGMNRVLIEIDTHHMLDYEAIDKVNKKRDEIANIYTRYEQGEVLSKAKDTPSLPGDVQPSLYAPVALVLEDQLAIGRIMIGIGVEPAIANKIAFANTEEITHCGDILTPWKGLIEVDPFLQEPATLTPSDIGNELGGLSAISVNKLLVKMGYQKRIGREWTPTTIGKLFARFIPQDIKHNSGVKRHMQLKWLPSIVDKVRETMYYKERGQQGLFLGECSWV